MESNLLAWLNNLFKRIAERALFLNKFFLFALFVLFLGFVLGNLFGTFLTFFRFLIPWDGLIVLFVLTGFEAISYFSYCQKGRSFVRFKVPLFTSLALSKEYQTSHFIFTQLLSNKNKKHFFRSQNLSKDRATISSNINFKEKESGSFSFTRANQGTNKKSSCLRFLNLLKIGVLLGFFIDAFKVGS